MTDRSRLNNNLRGLLRRHREFSVWEDNNGVSLCGFAAWEGRRISIASSERLARLKENPEWLKSARFARKGLQDVPYTKLTAEIFHSLGDPIAFEDLVELIALFRKIKDQPSASIESANEHQELGSTGPAARTGEHLTYDQLESFAENRLDAEETEAVNRHLETCQVCSEDVRSFLDFRAATESELRLRHTSEPRGPRYEKHITAGNQPANRRKPFYTILTLLILGLVGLASTLFSSSDLKLIWDQIAKSFQARATPSISLSRTSSPSASVTPSPTDSGEDTIVSLKDGDRTIRFNESGIISGLETFPAEIRQSITEALLTGALKRSAALNDLMSGQGAGSAERASVVLSYPRRMVILEDRPAFRWAPLDGASSYQVQVGDLQGNEIADSGQLSSTVTQWTPSRPLKRGIIYTWVVIAMVNGEEVTSPAPSSAEMRFRVLGWEKVNELTMLKNQYQSHLALGIFYTREGMLAEARREFQLLAKDNPDSPVVAKLLQRFQSGR